ncbi:MAG: hypothetical protein IPO92_14165 [Saprospiraceae bacterium]|nr:hypothetical protein [Saprospiraceae bacterium]
MLYLPGSSQKLKTKSENVLYKILLFKVRGGYSDLFGQKFNNHDGLDASRISIYKNEELIISLSYNYILNHDFVQVDSIAAYNIKLK